MTSRAADRPGITATNELSAVDGLAQLSFLIYGCLERRAAERGLSIVQTRLLGVLRDRRAGVNELATLLALDKSSVSGLVDRAERRGLMARTPSTTDRRAVLVELTDHGRSFASEVSTAFETDVITILDRLPAADRAQLSRLVSRLLVAESAAHGIDLFAGVDPR